MSYTNIRQALESNVANISGVPEVIIWDNVSIKPPDTGTWLRVTFAPTSRRPQDVSADGLKRFDGLLLIDIFGEAGDGPLALTTLVDATMTAFEAGTVVTNDSQTVEVEYAEADQLQIDGKWAFIPISIKWKAYN